jgi:hypothetical protein
VDGLGTSLGHNIHRLAQIPFLCVTIVSKPCLTAFFSLSFLKVAQGTWQVMQALNYITKNVIFCEACSYNDLTHQLLTTTYKYYIRSRVDLFLTPRNHDGRELTYSDTTRLRTLKSYCGAAKCIICEFLISLLCVMLPLTQLKNIL